MKTTVKHKREIEITAIRISVPVNYDEEDIPNDFPLRRGNLWECEVNMDSGQIANWPSGRTGTLSMKVCDGGTYTLLDPKGNAVAIRKNEYVPAAVPGEYGDYIRLKINANGVVTNWQKHPDVWEFFEADE